jgi:hypothetical protein
LASFNVGLDVTTKLEHRVPPPILWAQNPCFLWFTGRVALQNIENNEVPYKIFQAKELRAVSASVGRFRLEGDAKRACRDDVCRKTSGIIVRRRRELICKTEIRGQESEKTHLLRFVT